MMGDAIRRYRREKGMTQEEVAAALGVTASAVHKWETGKTLPDITLLAPLARLLGVSTDTLLDFRQSLTDLEIDSHIRHLEQRLRREAYEEAFAEGCGQVHEYPDSRRLALVTAQLLDCYRLILGIPEPERYDEEIIRMYRIAAGGERALSEPALTALFHLSLRRDAFQEAEKYLQALSEQGVDTGALYALLYDRQGKREQAMQVYERQILNGCQSISQALCGLGKLYLDAGETDMPRLLEEKLAELSRILEMGEYAQVSTARSGELERAVREQDAEAALGCLEALVQALGTQEAFHQQVLYRHLTLKKQDGFVPAQMLLKALERDPELLFLRGQERFENLVARLRRYVAEKA